MGKAVRFFMKDVLKLIVDTDKAARLKVQKAVDKREALNESLTKIKDEIYSRYDEKAKSLIKKESENAEAEIKKEKASIDAEIQRKKQELNGLFEKEHKAWEEHIVNAVISE